MTQSVLFKLGQPIATKEDEYISSFQVLAPDKTKILVDDVSIVVRDGLYYATDIKIHKIELVEIGPEYTLAINDKVGRFLGCNHMTQEGTGLDPTTKRNFGFPMMVAYQLEKEE